MLLRKGAPYDVLACNNVNIQKLVKAFFIIVVRQLYEMTLDRSNTRLTLKEGNISVKCTYILHDKIVAINYFNFSMKYNTSLK